MRTFIRSIVLGGMLLLGFGEAVQAKPAQLSVLAGIDAGGLILGTQFNLADTETESFGGYARVFSKDREEGQPSIFALGGSVTGFIRSGIFRYYVTPGFGLVHHSLERSELLFGPSLSLGLLAELDRTISVGVENSKLYSWIGEYKGLMKDAFLVQMNFML